jgi:flagellar biosynthetic protein FliQ
VQKRDIVDECRTHALRAEDRSMTPESVMSLAHQAMVVTLLLAAPLLLVALVVGLAISLFQAATQINETTLSFIPKLLAVAVTLVIAGPWMLTTMLDYMRTMFTSIASVGG